MLNKLNKLICSILLLSLFIIPVPAGAISANDLTDVKSTDWFMKDGSLPYALEHEIIKGYSDGRFGAADSLTIEQFIAVLTRVVLDRYPASREKYTGEYSAQYDSDHPYSYGGWADQELYIADRLEITKGFATADKAVYTAPITRFQMAQLVANTLLGPLMESPPDTSMVTDSFTDKASIEASPYKDSVGVAVALGIVQGSNGAFSGDRALVRSEVCAVAYRLMEPAARIVGGSKPIEAAKPEQEHITYENGKGKGQRLPIEGDKIIINGKEYTLEIDPTTGILGYGLPGVDYYTGNIDDFGDPCELGVMAESNYRGQSGTLAKGPDGSVFTKNQWFEIQQGTIPTGTGVEGQKSADNLWVWANRYGSWCWTGPVI